MLALALALPLAAAPTLAAPSADTLLGRHGGTLRTLVARDRDVRLMMVFGYARLIGYGKDLRLMPDILADFEMLEGGRAYRLHLRPGHRWSDGHPFTVEDFRYWWEDVASNPLLKPAGPPASLLVNGERPAVTFPDPHTVEYRWSAPNHRFPAALASSIPLFIYRPAHYLKAFHADYTGTDTLARDISKAGVSSWAQLHNRLDNMNAFDNPDLPTLHPWVPRTRPPASRHVFDRNPHFHRRDAAGQRLPYIDRVVMDVADARLIAAKTQAGESDLQARGLSFSDIAVLRRGARDGPFEARLWPTARGSHFALYPNLTAHDPVWRRLLRDRRFRQALSLGIDRTMINEVLYFGLAKESANTVVPESPLFRPQYREASAAYDPGRAAALLDEIGLTRRRGNGLRVLPDGRPLRIIVDTAGERTEESDILGLIAEAWREIGVGLRIKTNDRANMRARAFTGRAVMTAWWGWDAGLAAPHIPPSELAPMRQSTLCWPAWGQHTETNGKAGEPVDLAPARALLDLARAWERSTTSQERADIWQSMLAIHARETFIIGTLQGVPQPVVVSERLRNVPEAGLYSWEPGALFGLHRPDLFWLAEDAP